MEKDLIAYMKESFALKEIDMREYSPLTLAYIGDAIYDLIIRSIIVHKGNNQVKKLHIKASMFVNAAAQSALLEVIKEHLTEEEKNIYKRGRNAYSPTRAKNATMSEYRRATGLEALVGYLYLSGQYVRLIDLIKLGVSVHFL